MGRAQTAQIHPAANKKPEIRKTTEIAEHIEIRENLRKKRVYGPYILFFYFEEE